MPAFADLYAQESLTVGLQTADRAAQSRAIAVAGGRLVAGIGGGDGQGARRSTLRALAGGLVYRGKAALSG